MGLGQVRGFSEVYAVNAGRGLHVVGYVVMICEVSHAGLSSLSFLGISVVGLL